MSHADDSARKAFLGTLVDALGDRWIVGYAMMRPQGVIGATLRRQGVEGFVQIVPSVVENNVISWQPFPGTGRPHFDIKLDGIGHLRTCILADAVDALERWAAAKAPVVRSAPTPMLPLVRPILEAIAAATPPRIDDAIDVDAWELTPAGATQLAAARALVDTAAIARAFPRDDDGRLSLSTRALLARCESTKVRGDRAVFLAVQSLTARKGGDVLQLALVDANDVNETHRWMDAPHAWQAATASTDPRAADYVALVDAGDFDRALSLFGITLEPKVTKVLEGIPLGAGSKHTAAWQLTVRRALWSLAPWRLPTRAGRLVLLPHQHHQVKTWLAWSPPSQIDLDSSASNMRMARTSWQRDTDEDLERLGITRTAAPAASPMKPAARAKPAPVKPLAPMITGKDLWNATTALAHAKRRARTDAIAELVAYLATATEENDRANAMWIISQLVAADDGAAVARFLDDRHDLVRRMAIDAVKRAGYAAAVPTLAAMVNDGRYTFRFNAATAMKTLSGLRGASGTAHHFASSDPRVREAACEMVAMFDEGAKLLRPHVEKALLDEDAKVAAAAKKALLVLDKRG